MDQQPSSTPYVNVEQQTQRSFSQSMFKALYVHSMIGLASIFLGFIRFANELVDAIAWGVWPTRLFD